MTKIITLYHCSKCTYEARTKIMVRRHIAREHDKEPLFLCDNNLELMYGKQVMEDKAKYNYE